MNNETQRTEIRCPQCGRLHGVVLSGAFAIEILCRCKPGCKTRFVATKTSDKIACRI